MFFLSLDLLKPAGQRHRWREYLFLAVCGGLTSLLGLLVDQVTFRISPEYFTVGKGIGASPQLAWQVAKMGASAGLAAGATGGGIVLLVNRSPRHVFRLLRVVWVPLLAAAVCGAVAGALLWPAPWYIHPTAAAVLEPAAAHRFTIVWFIHSGVYAGGIAGLLYLLRRAWLNRG